MSPSAPALSQLAVCYAVCFISTYSATVMISSSGVFILATSGTLVSSVQDFAAVFMRMADCHDHDRLF